MSFIRENSLVLLLILGTAFTCFWTVKHREVLRLKWWTAVAVGILHTFIGLLFVKLFAVMETLDFSRFAGMSLFGGMFFMPAVYFLVARICKVNAEKVFDSFTPCIVFTIMCARINCLFSGCCLGMQIPGTQFRYPTREIELVFYICLLAYFILKEKKIKPVGIMYPLYLMTYGGFRFVCEFFRSSESKSIFHISHLWAVVSVLVGMVFYTELKSRQQKRKKKDNHHFYDV